MNPIFSRTMMWTVHGLLVTTLLCGVGCGEETKYETTRIEPDVANGNPNTPPGTMPPHHTVMEPSSIVEEDPEPSDGLEPDPSVYEEPEYPDLLPEEPLLQREDGFLEGEGTCREGAIESWDCEGEGYGVLSCTQEGMYDGGECLGQGDSGLLAQHQRLLVGTWEGVVETPWTSPSAVAMVFRSNGSYSAVNLEGGSALYYGTDEDHPSKVWELVDIRANGSSQGDITIYFGSSGSQNREMIDKVQFDEHGWIVSFEVWTRSGYGPIEFQLRRIGPETPSPFSE